MFDLETSRVRCPHCGFTGGIDDFDCLGNDIDDSDEEFCVLEGAWFCTTCHFDFMPEWNVVQQLVQQTLLPASETDRSEP